VVIVEQIFAIPGLGRLTLTAITTREYRVLQASLLVIAFMFASVNLVTDLVYAYLDPRIKYD
jgi:peptide/nickel transport system permease protein